MSYYANTVAQAFFFESVIANALLLMENRSRSGITSDGRVTAFSKQEFCETCFIIVDIFKNEFPHRNNFTVERVDAILVKLKLMGYLNIDGETIIMNKPDKEGYKRITFMSALIKSFVDSYTMVLLALSYIMENGSVVQKKYVLQDMHQCIQEIYFQGAITHLNSCLIETLENSFSRFAQMGVCEMNGFESNSGPAVFYIKCPVAKRDLINRYLNILEAMSSLSNQPEKQKIIELEIEEAIKLSTGSSIPKL